MKIRASIRELTARIGILIENDSTPAYVVLPAVISWESTLVAGPRGEDARFELLLVQPALERGIELSDEYLVQIQRDVRAQLRAWLDAIEARA